MYVSMNNHIKSTTDATQNLFDFYFISVSLKSKNMYTL